MNLYVETIDKLRENGKTKLDILWIGCKDFKIDNFWDIASITDYELYGTKTEVPYDLILVGKGFIMNRVKAWDGSEEWNFINFQEPQETKFIRSLCCSHAESFYNSSESEKEYYSNETLAKINKINIETKE